MRELAAGLKMEGDILDALEALGYTGPLLEEEALKKAVENGLSSPEFFDLCVWLGSQIKPLCNMEESITPTDVFLSTELQALKILHSKKSKGSHLEKHNEIYQEVQAICDALGLPNSSPDIPPLLTNVEQKERLEKINDALRSEYECRRRMLMKRLDVTVQSFGWSDRAKLKTDDIARIYQPKRYALSPKSTITLAHLLAAREDLSKIIRTSSGSTRENTVCAINKYLIVEADQQRLNHHLLKCLHGRKDKKVAEEVAGEVVVEGVAGVAEGVEEEEEVVVVVLEVGVSEVVEEVEVASKVEVAGEIMVAGEVMVAGVVTEIHMVEEEAETAVTTPASHTGGPEQIRKYGCLAKTDWTLPHVSDFQDFA
ncbi:Protein FAM98B [Aix galericulata]|nr:Protein FAM98B [Aix galericulata]